MNKIKSFFSNEKIKEYINISLGSLLVAFSFSFFLDPMNLVIGGGTGIATILKNTIGLNTAITVFIVNVVTLIIGLIFLGKDFFFKTLFGSLAVPAFIAILNLIYGLIPLKDGQPWINDKMLVILFSAFIMGVGLGITIKNGGSTGGTEIPQNILYKYLRMPYSVSLWLIDGIIVVIGSFFIHEEGQIMDPHMILYALIFIFISGVVMDQIVFSGFNSRAVHIISEKNDEIKERILKDFDRGVTQIQVVGGYTNQEKSKLVCILSSSEYYRLKKIIHECDPNAFYYVVRANEVTGEGFSKK